MENTQAAPFVPTAWHAAIVEPLKTTATVSMLVADTEDEAVEWARSMVGPNITQVSLTARDPDNLDTFAVRHIHPEGHYSGKTDSGWRCWVDGEFIGAVTFDPPDACGWWLGDPDPWARCDKPAGHDGECA